MQSKLDKITLGKYGEKIACEFLRKNKYTIITQNFKCKQGEIDIIAKDLNYKDIVFVEVKTRTNLNYGIASEAVNKNKIEHIYKSAQFYILKNNIKNQNIRIDVIEIYIKLKEKKVIVNHIKNIF